MAKRCVALCIGINDYEDDYFHTLKNAESDAHSVAGKLTELKYEVIELIGNVKYDDYLNKFGAFSKILYDNIDVAIIYIAGHGFMANGSDCVALKDTPCPQGPNGDTPAKGKSIVIKNLCDDLRAAGNQINIIIIDACRKEINTVWRGGGYTKPFGQNTTIPFQTYIAFATSPGAGAKDGVSEHSPYTAALLEEMSVLNQPIESTFKKVRQQLFKEIGDQLPWEHSCLIDEFSFNYGQLSPYYDKMYSEKCYNRNSFVPTDDKIGEIYSLLNQLDNDANFRGITLLLTNKSSFSKEIIFLMGRLISMSITKGSGFLFEWLRSTNLKLFTNNNENHLFNGILYEMYFDEYGIMRERMSTNVVLLNKIELLSVDEIYKSSCDFIKEELGQEGIDNFFYIPGMKDTIKLSIDSVDADLIDKSHNRICCITSIDDKNMNIDCDGIFDHQMISTKLGDIMQIPHRLLKVNYKNAKSSDKFVFYQIQNLYSELKEALCSETWSDINSLSSLSYIEDIDNVVLNDLYKDGDLLIAEGHCETTIHMEFDYETMPTMKKICRFELELKQDGDLWTLKNIKTTKFDIPY